MATIKSYTDLEQSKKLAEILPLESADMKILPFNEREYRIVPINDISVCGIEDEIHAWSLAALLDYISANFRTDIKYLDNYWELDCRVRVTYSKELVDACYEMIVKLHDLKLL